MKAEQIYMQEQEKHPMKFGAYILPEKWQLDAMQAYADQQTATLQQELDRLKNPWVFLKTKEDHEKLNTANTERTIMLFDNGEVRFYLDRWPFAQTVAFMELPEPPQQ